MRYFGPFNFQIYLICHVLIKNKSLKQSTTQRDEIERLYETLKKRDFLTKQDSEILEEIRGKYGSRDRRHGSEIFDIEHNLTKVCNSSSSKQNIN